MNWFKVTIKLKAPTGTLWQADTVFGHLCWTLAHRDGEAALKHFLEPFLDGQPPFLLSDGFPSGFLPRPLSFRLPDEDSFDSFQSNRKLRRHAYLKEDEFRRAIQGEVFEPVDSSQELKRAFDTRAVLKNQISRLTGTTSDEGNLYGFIEHWMPKVVIYGKVQPEAEDFLKQLFQEFCYAGYGKRKAVGYGAIGSLEFSRIEGFIPPQDTNGFMTLSTFLPAPDDPTKGRWRINVKYGRLGEEYAISSNPFKKPLVMLIPGSVFYYPPNKEYYGRMVEDVSVITGVVSYGYALPVPVQLPLFPETSV